MQAQRRPLRRSLPETPEYSGVPKMVRKCLRAILKENADGLKV
jgi:hypothetical protein